MTSIRPSITLTAALATALLAAPVNAGSISLAWDPVPGATSYRVYYGKAPGAYLGSVAVQGATQADVSGLDDCTTYYLAVKAQGPGGAVSTSYSDEVVGWSRPEIATAPVVTRQGQQFVLSIVGTNFRSAGQVLLDGSVPRDVAGTPLIRFEDVDVVGCSRIDALVTVEAASRGQRAMPIGPFGLRVEVRHPDGVVGEGMVPLSIDLGPERCDINRSDDATRDRVDGKDLTWLAYAYGTAEGEPRYNPDADLTGDGVIDGQDLVYIAREFGTCWDGLAWDADACS